MSVIANAHLFPVDHSLIYRGFSTSVGVNIPNVSLVSLSDKALGVHKVSSQTTHKIVVPPCSDTSHGEAWEALFPKESINPGNTQHPHGGFGFYLNGPPAFATELRDEKPKEVLMSYEVLFEKEWVWRKGGKLPDGGVGDAAYGCTGGRQTDRCMCFNLRLMWREDGDGELYAYLPQNEENTAQLLAIPPRSIQHPDYGFSVGRGAWRFEPDKWTAVAQRVKMNSVGRADGEVEVFIDGRTVIKATGLILQGEEGSTKSYVHGLHFQSFFGGHTPDWASPRDQKAWFTHISGAILQGTEFGHDEL